MRIGYARVSSFDQNLSAQLDALTAAKCEFIYQEKKSGVNMIRTELLRCLKKLRPGDVLVVTKLDRLARSTADLLSLVAEVSASGAQFVSLAEPWADTSSPAGTLIITVMAGIAQFERSRMLERCREGRAAAKARGLSLGRPFALNDVQTVRALEMLKGGESPHSVAGVFNVSPATIYRLRLARGLA